jgi:hypothetical protein
MAGYEGWKNWETWQLNLTLSNDEPLHREWSKLAREAVEDSGFNESVAVTYFADRMQEELTKFLDGGAFGKLPEYAQNILSQSMREVDWRELSEHWIASAIETKAYAARGTQRNPRRR